MTPTNHVCRHDPCTCPVPEGQDYCSEECRGAVQRGDADDVCACGHEACGQGM